MQTQSKRITGAFKQALNNAVNEKIETGSKFCTPDFYDIADRHKVSRRCVNNELRRMEDDQLIVRDGEFPASKGQTTVAYKGNPNAPAAKAERKNAAKKPKPEAKPKAAAKKPKPAGPAFDIRKPLPPALPAVNGHTDYRFNLGGSFTIRKDGQNILLTPAEAMDLMQFGAEQVAMINQLPGGQP